jgi:O-antigen/teichoic acid export membrane protein
MSRLQDSLIRLLRWSEKYTKTDMVYLASGGFWSTVGQIVVSLCALALSVVLARYLSQDNYGDYRYVLSVVAILGTFSLGGLSTAVFQSVARGFNGALREGFRLDIRWSGVIFVGSLVIGGYYLLHGNMVLGVGILVGGLLSPFISGAQLAPQFLAAKKDFARQNIYGGMWNNLLPTIAVIVAAIFTQNVIVVVVVYFAASTVTALYFYYRTLRIYHSDSASKDPEMLSYSKHMSLMGILSGIAGNIDSLLVFHFVGAPALAVYSFATGVVDQGKGPLKNLDNMVQAQFVNRDSAGIQGGMGGKIGRLFLFSLVCVIVYVFLAPYVYGLLFPNYLAAIPYSQVYSLTLLAVTFWPAASYLKAKKRVREQYIGTITNSIILILFIAIGVIVWGVWGLIFAKVLSTLLGWCINYALYRYAVADETAYVKST